MRIEFARVLDILIMTYITKEENVMRLYADLTSGIDSSPVPVANIYFINRQTLLTRDEAVSICNKEGYGRPRVVDYISDDRISFKIASIENGYYIFEKTLFDGLEVQISTDIEVKDRYFRAQRNVSIMKKLGKLGFKPIIIGGDKEKAIPLETYRLLLKRFPTGTELDRYAEIGRA